MQHTPETVISLFNQTFIRTYNTELVKGEDEPIYLPADDVHPHHRILFAHGFFASALHEISHWCVAGKERRLLEDFGYWYEPDGRTIEQQSEFEKVEVKPQALEWIFSESADFKFHFSADNLNGEAGISEVFKQAVLKQVQIYLENGLPKRAQAWSDCLVGHFRAQTPLQIKAFCLQNVG